MTTRRKVIIAAAGIVIALAVALSFRAPAVPVEVAAIRRDTLAVTVEEEGRTQARNTYTVAAPITGRLSRTHIEEGDDITRGDALVSIAPPPEDSRSQFAMRAQLDAARARQRQMEATLVEAEQTNEQARREVDRRLPLFEQGAMSKEVLERFEQAAEAAAARLDIAQAALRAAIADVEVARSRFIGSGGDMADGATLAVRAPVSGTVLRVYEASERVVAAGTPLFDIADDDGLEIIVDLLTEDAVNVHHGNAIRIEGWGRDEILQGKVRYVEPAAFTKVSALGVEEQRVNVIGDIRDAPPSLGVGFRVNVAIVTWTGYDVVKVPTSAIFQRGNEWRVFVVERGRARLRTVELGARATEYAEVRSGLEPEDMVILFPSDLVEDGVRVATGG